MLIECRGCGAPLDVPDARGFVRCSYCGRASRLGTAKVIQPTTPTGWSPPAEWQSANQNKALSYKSAPRVVQMRLLIVLGVGLPLLATAIAAVLAVVRPEPPPAAPVAPPRRAETRSWDGAESFRCSGDEWIVLQQTAPAVIATGAAVVASGHCRLDIEGANISSPVGVRVEDSARVEISGTLSVSEVGVEAEGESQVTLSGSIMPLDTETDGPSPHVGIRLSGRARAVVHSGSVTAVTAAEIDGDSSLRLRYAEVWCSGDAIVARGRAQLYLLRPRIHAAGVGVRLLDEARGESGDRGSIEGSPVAVDGAAFTPDPLTQLVDVPPLDP